MRRLGRRFGLFLVVAAVCGATAAAVPAGAASVPSTPAKPTATPANAAARVNWVAPAANGSAINAYFVTPFIGAVAQPAHMFGSTARTGLVTGLENGTTYTFKVKARNGVGVGANSVASGAVKVGTPASPGKPATAPGNAQVRLNWVAPANSGHAISGYVVTPFIGAAAQTAHTYTSAAVAEVVTGLTNGTTYTFKVAAKNAIGTGPVSPVSGAVAPTAQPALSAVMNATIGQPILVNSQGMTVYAFGPDGTGTHSMVQGALRAAWPYVTWSGTVSVGTGLTPSSAAANIQTDNSRLVSYNGHLLYTFVSDTAPGDVTGQAVAGFYVVSAAGTPII
jgi:predicted lipoprotein with Yx(FWY)xxD motif